MTDVGKIKLGVEIDASDLSAKLGTAVRKAIAPALAEIQRELQKVQHEYDATARAAEKSDAAQVAGAKAVADALGKVDRKQVEAAASSTAAETATRRHKTSNDALSASTRKVAAAQNELNTAVDIFGRKSPQAEAAQGRLNVANKAHTEALIRAAAQSRASTDSRINDYQRLARAAEVSAAKQQAANRVASEGHRGRRGGVLGFLTGPAGLNTIALGAQALPAALTGVTALVGAVQQLGQAGLALPAIYGAVGASIGVALLGFHGMKDAVKALNDAAKSGDPKDLEKATKALKDMDPAAAAVAVTLSKLTQGPLKALQKGVQGHMFAGFDKDLQALGDKAIPRLTGNFNKIGDAWNGTLKQITGSLGSERNLSLFDRFLGNTAEGQKRANGAIEPITHALATLMSTGGEFLPRLGDALTKVANRFDNFISNAGKTGKLWKWIDEGLNGLRALGNAVLNIGKTLTGLTHAVGGDGGFLGWLERATGKMSAFVNSADGQGKLRDFFTMGREGLHQWGDLFKELGPILLKIIEGFATWGQVTLPIVTAIAQLVNWLGQVPGLIQGVIVALLAFKTGNMLLGLGGKFGLGGGLAGTAAGAGGGMFGSLGFGTGGQRFGTGLLGLGIAAGGNMIQQSSQMSGNTFGQVGGALGTIGGTALTGAALGSIFPGPGTAIGAGLGAALGVAIAGMTFVTTQHEKATRDAAEAQRQYAASLAATTAMLDAQSQAHKSVQDALVGSGGKIDPSVIAGAGEMINQIPGQIKSEWGSTRAEQATAALKELKYTTEQLTNIVTGAPPQFDALIARLQTMGTGGQALATHLADVRNQVLGMANTASATAPLMQTLADAMGTNVMQAAVNLNNAFEALPKNIPLVDSPRTRAFLDIMHELGALTHVDGNHQIVFDFLPANVVDMLHDLNINIQQLQNKTVQVGVDPGSIQTSLNQLGVLGNALGQLHGQILGLPSIPSSLPAPGAPGGGPPLGLPPGPPRAQGGIARRRGYAGGGMLPLFSDQGQAGDTTYRGYIIRAGEDGPDKRAMIDLWIDHRNDVAYRAGLPGLAGQWWNWNSTPDLPEINATGNAAGGLLRGYSPGVDNMMVPLSGGEGIIIPEAMKALGGDWLYNLNSQFRSGLSRTGYAGGGVVGGFDDGGIVPGDTTTIGLLTQIRDLLAGRGTAGAPLNTIADATRANGGTAGGAGAVPGKTWGGGQGFVKGIVDWFFGDGASASLGLSGVGAGGLGAPGVGGMPGAGIDFGRYSGALSAFAHSGNLADVTGLGLGVNSPVITALTSARNKKRGGLSDDQISALVDQIIGGGGFSGTLDEQNTPLIKSLQRYRDQLAKQGGGIAAPGPVAPGTAAGAAFGGGDGLVPFDGSGAGNAQALIAFAQAANGGKYAAASDLAGGLADCSGAVSDLVEFLTKGRASPERLFSTTNEAQVLQGLGAVPGLVPGSLQIGLNPGHTAATLPNGVNFESGGSGGGVVYGGPVGAGDKQFTQTFSLPTDLTGRVVGAGFGGMPIGGSALGGGSGGGPVPVYVTNWGGGSPGGPGGSPGIPPGLAGVGQAALGSAGQVISDVGGDIIDGTAGSILPARLMGVPTHPDSATAALFHQGNVLGAGAKLAGLSVPDYTRSGANYDFAAAGSPFDATGRLFSDTRALADRSATDQVAAINAMRSQTVAVMKQVDTKLSEQVLKPLLSTGVTTGFSAVGSSVFESQGRAMGETAGPIMATAVAQAIPTSSGGGSGGGDSAGTVANGLGGILNGVGDQLMAGGGAVYGGTPGIDSVPILAQQGEYIFDTKSVSAMGGISGAERFHRALSTGSLRRFAGGGKVGSGPSSSANLGADFFGVSQIPLIGAILNLLINVLLKVIGVNIDMRNTLTNISGDFRSFRGDAFKAFDAQGRLFSDTSGLTDRSTTSGQTAADERIKILEKVIAGLIQFIIDKVIVPLMKAVAQAAIQAAGSAVSAGITGASFGAGGAGGAAASSFITAFGDASVDIGAQVGQAIADALVQELIPLIGGSLQSILPQLMTTVFSGLLPEMVLSPVAAILTTVLGGFAGVLTALFGGVFGGVSTLIPGLPFDKGGMARGKGYLPKATADPELVLSPGETDIFTRFVGALERGGFGGNKTVHAPITVMQAGPETAQQVQDRLLQHMP